jgi:hypothetical protein
MKNIIWILLLASLSACMTENKARRRVATLKSEYPHVLASFCDVKEKETNTIQYIKGERDTLWQAEYVDCDTVIGENRIVKVPYPVYVPSVDSVIIVNEKVIDNKEQINALNAKLTETTYKLYKAETHLRIVLWALAIIVAINAVIIIIKRFF